jgi:hypothetical protein
MSRQQQIPQAQITSDAERTFHSVVSLQIKTQIKIFEMKLDSVRKEREHMI